MDAFAHRLPYYGRGNAGDGSGVQVIISYAMGQNLLDALHIAIFRATHFLRITFRLGRYGNRDTPADYSKKTQKYYLYIMRVRSRGAFDDCFRSYDGKQSNLDAY